MTQYVFGTGQLFASPVGGGAGPLRFGALQDVSVDFNADTKLLHGQYGFALDAARGKMKVEWKAGTANIDIAGFNQIFFNQTLQLNKELKQVFNEAASVPGASTYTVTAANGATFYRDLGVYYANTGLPLKQVASGPSAGQYSVNLTTGVYTFSSSDASAAVLLNYLYEGNTGGSIELTNQLMGQAPKFELVLSQVYDGKTFTLILYSCVAEKLSMPLKQDDHMVSELSGSAQANAANKVGRITTTSTTGGGN